MDIHSKFAFWFWDMMGTRKGGTRDTRLIPHMCPPRWWEATWALRWPPPIFVRADNLGRWLYFSYYELKSGRKRWNRKRESVAAETLQLLIGLGVGGFKNQTSTDVIGTTAFILKARAVLFQRPGTQNAFSTTFMSIAWPRSSFLPRAAADVNRACVLQLVQKLVLVKIIVIMCKQIDLLHLLIGASNNLVS